MTNSDCDVLVIGVDGANNGDDSIGCEIVRRLGPLELPGVVACCHDRMAPNLAELWSGYEIVYVIDAMRGGGPPGSILRLDGHTGLIPERYGLDPGRSAQLRRAIELTRALDALPEQLTLFGVEVAQRVPSGGLSHPVDEAAERLTHRIAAEIRRHHGQLSAG